MKRLKHLVLMFVLLGFVFQKVQGQENLSPPMVNIGITTNSKVFNDKDPKTVDSLKFELARKLYNWGNVGVGMAAAGGLFIWVTQKYDTEDIWGWSAAAGVALHYVSVKLEYDALEPYEKERVGLTVPNILIGGGLAVASFGMIYGLSEFFENDLRESKSTKKAEKLMISGLAVSALGYGVLHYAHYANVKTFEKHNKGMNKFSLGLEPALFPNVDKGVSPGVMLSLKF